VADAPATADSLFAAPTQVVTEAMPIEQPGAVAEPAGAVSMTKEENVAPVSTSEQVAPPEQSYTGEEAHSEQASISVPDRATEAYGGEPPSHSEQEAYDEQPIDGEQLAAVESDGASYWDQPEQTNESEQLAAEGAEVSADVPESPWVQGWTEEGYAYWFNTITGESSWEDPNAA